MKFIRHIQKLQKFLTEDIWIIELNQFSSLKRLIFKQMRVFYIVIKSFLDDKCQLRGAALTFRTLLSIVPFFALVFAVAKGFGFQKNLEPILLEKIAPGQKQIVDNIINYIENTNVKALGSIGFISLIGIVNSMFSMTEETFNDIWGVKHPRHIFRKLGNYLAIVIIIPLLFMLVTVLNTILVTNMSNLGIMNVKIIKHLMENLPLVLPYFITCFAFIGIYKFMPNTNVNFSAAFFGGIIGGAMWQFLEWVYINFQIGVARYNAIYGAFASFPVFLMWIYVSWLVLLFGAEISFAYQNEKNYIEGKTSENVTFALKEKIALGIMYALTFSFTREKKVQTAENLANVLNVPVRIIREILFIFCEKGLLAEISNDKKKLMFQPAVPVENIKVADVFFALKNYGTQYFTLDENFSGGKISKVAVEMEELCLKSNLNKSFKELLEEKDKSLP